MELPISGFAVEVATEQVFWLVAGELLAADSAVEAAVAGKLPVPGSAVETAVAGELTQSDSAADAATAAADAVAQERERGKRELRRRRRHPVRCRGRI